MTINFADRLLERVRRLRAPVCVGLDPLIDRLPPCILRSCGVPVECKQPRGISDLDAAARALLAFGRGIIEAVAPHVPVLKINIAFFEPFRDAGIRTYYELVQIAHQAGMLVIGDIKRADIGHSTTQYAVAHLGGSGLDDSTVPDAVTVNPYFGLDAVKPFSDIARDTGRGLFVLVATSNESAAQVQGITLNDGRIVSDAVAELVESWASAEGMLGSSGYSCVGAVVSPRDLPATKRIRTLMPHCTFLVPGFGAQGRSADEVATCFRNDGAGAIVTASRTVIYAYEDAQRGTSETDWRVSVASTCRDFVNAVREVIPAC